jgi:hypothetical protein
LLKKVKSCGARKDLIFYLYGLTKIIALKNPKAIKLLNKMIDDVQNNGIITNTAVKDLKALRPYAIEEEKPLLAKIIRLTFEHIEEYETFAIDIPEEEPIEGHEEELEQGESSEPAESLLYLLNLIAEPDNKSNRLDLRAYADALKEYEEKN